MDKEAHIGKDSEKKNNNNGGGGGRKEHQIVGEEGDTNQRVRESLEKKKTEIQKCLLKRVGCCWGAKREKGLRKRKR